MKTHGIIPIFIPHRGCGHSCVFCNQHAITARQPDVTPDDVRTILDTWLSTMQRLEMVEAAFYGGSFTGLPLEEQAGFLAVAKEYKNAGRIQRIHLSTRPDYIDERILDQLREYGVDIIELGVQSFDPDVLAASRRGHTVEDVYRACELIHSYGFTLGIQLMIGLPEDSREKCLDSARKTVSLHPALARLYPTVVLADTELARMYQAGLYQPLTNEEAVSITKDMYRILDDAGITILRVGLKSTDIIADSGAPAGGAAAGDVAPSGEHSSAVLAHTFHPAFRQLVEGELAKEKMEQWLQEILAGSPEQTRSQATSQTGTDPLPRVTFSSCGESFSNMVGHKACNKKHFAKKYPHLRFHYAVDPALPRGVYHGSFEDR